MDRPPTMTPHPNHIRATKYEIHYRDGVAVAIAPDSTKLPIYNGVINNQTSSKTIIDSGATTTYIRDTLVKEQGYNVMKISPRTVIVANHDKIQVNGIVSVDLKLDGLPSERIIAYTFPLGNIDVILGLPWLKKHHPRLDWDKDAYEFTRYGRRYMLYPQTSDPPTIKIVPDPSLKDPTVVSNANMNIETSEILLTTAEDFNDFVNDSTHLYWIDIKNLSEKGMDLNLNTTTMPHTETKLPRRLL